MIRRWLPPLCIAAAFLATAVAWSHLPDRVPMHWNLGGEVDRYGGRVEGALFLPALMVVLYAAMRGLPRIDPRGRNFERMAGTYDYVIALTLGFLLVTHAAVLAIALGYPVPMQRLAPAGVGALLLAVGNVLPRARPNWWFGVRTPWTLSDDRVWARTHRVAGYSMMAAGLVILASAFLPPPMTGIMLVAGVGLGAGYPIVYSYFAWRQERASR